MFRRRQKSLPDTPPLALTSEFYNDPAKQTQWRAFLRKGKLGESELLLAEVTTGVIAGFVMPSTVSVIADDRFQMRWMPGGPWISSG